MGDFFSMIGNGLLWIFISILLWIFGWMYLGVIFAPRNDREKDVGIGVAPAMIISAIVVIVGWVGYFKYS